jgi:hypothetical protein
MSPPTPTPILQTIDVPCSLSVLAEGRGRRKIHTTWRWLAGSLMVMDDPDPSRFGAILG